jgi:hypothetical protein
VAVKIIGGGNPADHHRKIFPKKTVEDPQNPA